MAEIVREEGDGGERGLRYRREGVMEMSGDEVKKQ